MPASTLESELHQSLALSQQLASDNERLMAAYSKLQHEHTAQSKSLQQTTEDLALAQQAKQVVERECESLYKDWQLKLSEQTQHFSKLASSMVPHREIQVLRVQLIDEIESNHASQLQQLASQVEQYQKEAHHAKRELALQIQANQLTDAELRQALQLQRTETDARCSELQTKNQKLMDEVNSVAHGGGTGDTHTVELERQLALANVRIRKLTQQCEQLTSDASHQSIATKQQQLAQTKREQEAELQIATLRKEAEVQLRRHDDLHQELSMLQKNESQWTRRMTEYESQHQSMQDRLEASERQCAFLRDAAEKRQNDLARNEADSLGHLRTELALVQSQLTASQEALMNLQHTQELTQRDSLLAMRNMKESHHEESKASDLIKMRLTEQVGELTRQLAEVEKLAFVSSGTLQHEHTQLQRQYDALKAEHAALQQSIHSERTDLQLQKQEYSAVQKLHQASEQEYATLSGKYRALLDKSEQQQSQIETLQGQLAALQQEHTASQRDVDRTHSDLVSTLQQQQHQWRTEKQILLQRIASSQAQREDSSSSSSDGAKVQKYKKLSIQLKAKCDEILNDYAAYKARHDDEPTNQHSQSHDAPTATRNIGSNLQSLASVQSAPRDQVRTSAALAPLSSAATMASKPSLAPLKPLSTPAPASAATVTAPSAVADDSD